MAYPALSGSVKCVECGMSMELHEYDPLTKSYDEDGFVCSDLCEQRDRLKKAAPTDCGAVLDAAWLLFDDGDFREVRIFQPVGRVTEPVTVVKRYALGGQTVYVVSDPEGAEADLFLSTIEQVEVVEDA